MKTYSYIKVDIETEKNNKSIQLEFGPNLNPEDIILTLSTIVSSAARHFDCSENDLLIEIIGNSLQMRNTIQEGIQEEAPINTKAMS